MLEFVAGVFRGFINVLLWLLLIAFVVGGFITGGNLLGGWGFSFGYAFLGLIIGIILGLITIILTGGLIANFLNMVDDINIIKSQLLKTGNTSSGNYVVSNTNNTQNAPPINKNSSGSWVCKKCKETNTENKSTCKWCGEYR